MEENTECVSDLVAYSKELEQEKLFLTSLLSKIDKEIHALQVRHPIFYSNKVLKTD